ncbi:pyrimidine/purine nucleoside phosphorylase [Paenibacillus tuaregi]|uniref:pyrimidine/purine nucleoside phosphorylase n=1 Tax=Paenibacillus tuaregi TaxID=1816681 RepID=UPI00083894FB|nr:pyrimidine/purine nucleoside phosphorylase [Paenibacillus tuaregi]
MPQFKNVTVDLAANIYFDGKVTSRSVYLEDGSKITLGIMLPGSYEFGTDTEEVMQIQSGDLKVLLPDETEWREINGQGEFTVPAGRKFKLEVTKVTDYVCSYR